MKAFLKIDASQPQTHGRLDFFSCFQDVNSSVVLSLVVFCPAAASPVKCQQHNGDSNVLYFRFIGANISEDTNESERRSKRASIEDDSV